MSQPIRFFLKDATAKSHLKLDTLVSQLDLSTKTGLLAFLKMHALALSAIEPFLSANGVSKLLPDWNERTRLGAAQNDLRALGECGELSQPPVFKSEATIPDLLGMLYTIEGSRLGARVLHQQAGEHCIAGGSQFLQHGLGKKFWPTFLGVLEGHDMKANEAESAAHSANRIFNFYVQTFEMSYLEPVS